MKSKSFSLISFNLQEGRAILLLILLICGSIIIRISLPYLKNDSINYSSNEILIIDSLVVVIDAEAENYKNRYKNNNTEVEAELFVFNPNQIDEEQWEKLGFSEGQAKGIINFRNSGFEFRVKADVAKLFCVDEEKYSELEAYINLPDTISYEKKDFQNAEKEHINIDINSANKEQFKSLNGIGEAYSKRIIEYRDKTGGFYYKAQIKEVWGIDSTVYNKISSHIYVDLNNIVRIDVNTATFEQLYAHPYISKTIASSIINYRKNNGGFTDLMHLKHVLLLSDEKFTVLSNYLRCSKV